MRYSVLISKTQDYRVDVSAPAGTPNPQLAELAINTLSVMKQSSHLRAAVGSARIQLQEATEILPNWSGAQASAAAIQGWRIGEHVSGLAVIQVSACPGGQHDGGPFKSDNAAAYWVRYKAEQGDELCADAVAYINYVNSGEGAA